MKKNKRIIIGIVIAIIVFLGFGGLGFFYGQHTFEPKIVIKIEYKEIPHMVLIPQPIFYTQEKIIEVEKIVEVYSSLKPFKTEREFHIWVANNYIKDAILGKCVDTALRFCQLAWNDGFQMSTELQGDGNVEGHMICSTVIDDKIWFCEPSNGFCWLGGKKIIGGR